MYVCIYIYIHIISIYSVYLMFIHKHGSTKIHRLKPTALADKNQVHRNVQVFRLCRKMISVHWGPDGFLIFTLMVSPFTMNRHVLTRYCLMMILFVVVVVVVVLVVVVVVVVVVVFRSFWKQEKPFQEVQQSNNQSALLSHHGCHSFQVLFSHSSNGNMTW